MQFLELLRDSKDVLTVSACCQALKKLCINDEICKEAISEGIDPRLEFPQGMAPEKVTRSDPDGNFYKFLHSYGGGTLTTPGTTLPEVSGPRTVAAPTAAPLSISPIPSKAPELCPGLVLNDSPQSVSSSDTLAGDPWEMDSPASVDSPLFPAFNAGQSETRKPCQKQRRGKRSSSLCYNHRYILIL